MANALRLLAPARDPVVIFIDDLDRCSPTNVGEVIEAMNLFLAGEYPRCAFVIGIDAEVVAASMEVVHAEIIEKLDKRSGELGWRFLDKFVQLPFVMPRLHPDQREGYLRGLFAVPSREEVPELVAQANALASQASDGALPADEFAERVADLRPRLAAVEPEIARALGEQAVEQGARDFSDDDPEVVVALASQMRYLSDNPRTIKRAVNLYRFHHFAAFARRVSTLPVNSATPAQIGRWIVVIIRWPQFVRWLQAEHDQGGPASQDVTSLIMETAAKTGDLKEFKQALVQGGITASWTDDLELLEFLHERVDPNSVSTSQAHVGSGERHDLQSNFLSPFPLAHHSGLDSIALPVNGANETTLETRPIWECIRQLHAHRWAASESFATRLLADAMIQLSSPDS